MKNARSYFENHLNHMAAMCFSQSEAVDYFAYLKEGTITEHTITSHYINHTLGSLLRVHDTLAFTVLFNDWRREYLSKQN